MDNNLGLKKLADGSVEYQKNAIIFSRTGPTPYSLVANHSFNPGDILSSPPIFYIT